MVALELRRSDIGFGRVIVDDRGVTRRSAFSTASIAWDDITDYRLKIEMRGQQLEFLYLSEWLDAILIPLDIRNGYRGEHRFRFGIELLGDAQRVAFNWRFRGVAIAIAQIYRRIRKPLAARARAAFAADGLGQFGPLVLADHGIQWRSRSWLASQPPALPRDAVESVELFNSSPVSLRVMARGKAWPYGQAPTAEIPNIAAALELAEALGYTVRDRGLFERLAIRPSPEQVTLRK